MQVLEPFNAASETTKRLLSGPNGTLGTWFSFGVIFFLQSCADGGGGGNFNGLSRLGNLIPSGGGSGSGGGGGGGGSGGTNMFLHSLGSAKPAPFDMDHLADLATPGIIVLVMLMVLFLALLALGLGSVGEGLAIAAVASGRPELAMTDRVKTTSIRMFTTHLLLGFLSLLVLSPVLVLGIMTVAQHSDNFGLLAGVGALSFLFLIPIAFIGAFMRNFAAPIVYQRGCTMMEAYQSITRAPGFEWSSVVGAYCVRFLMALVAGAAAMFVAFCTCCIGALPVLAQTALAPYFIFERAHTLHMLASLGPEFNVLEGEAPPFDGFGPQGFVRADQGPRFGP